MSRWATALSLLALSGCGPTAVLWVRVEAPLVVPEQADAATLLARRDGEAGPVVFEQSYDLAGEGLSFPLELSLTTRNDANLGAERISLTATALKGGERAAPWASATVPASLERGQVTEALVQLCDCAE